MTVEQDLEYLEKEYDELYDETITDVMLDDSQLKEALKTQIHLEIKWERITKKVKRIKDEYEQLSDESYSDAIKIELKDSYRSSTITEAKEFAKTDPEFRTNKRLFIKAKNLYDETSGILAIIESRRYILNNMTSAMVSSVEKAII